MKKVSTAATKQIRNFSTTHLTIGLDLGDRSSWYCVLDGVGEVILEQKLSTTPKAMKEVFGAIPRSRIALETGTHYPWVRRLLSELEHEVIVAHARNVRLIAESRRKDDRVDARTLARLARIDPQLLCPIKHRSARAQADLAVIRARAGLVRARTELVNTARGLAKSYGERLCGCYARKYESRESGGLSPEPRTANRVGAIVSRTGVAERAHPRVQRTGRKAGARTLSAGGAAEAGAGSGRADRAHLQVDAGKPTPLFARAAVRAAIWTAARTQELRPERAADAHQ
jgi:transposase